MLDSQFEELARKGFADARDEADAQKAAAARARAQAWAKSPIGTRYEDVVLSKGEQQ